MKLGPALDCFFNPVLKIIGNVAVSIPAIWIFAYGKVRFYDDTVYDVKKPAFAGFSFGLV